MKIIYSDNINGILGTVIFHLVLILFFLVVKTSDAKRKHIEYMPIDFEEEMQEIEDIIREIERMPVNIEPLEEEVRKNIAVNVANNLNEKISTEKYIEQLKEEMGIDNLEQHLDRDLPDKEEFSYDEEPIEKNDEETKTDKEYSGPTNVTYFLENRSERYLPVPVYTCKGGGLVIVNISVNQKGKVIYTSISEDSQTQDECLHETALKYAGRTTFNMDYEAEPRQSGYIMYQFIPQ